MKREEDCRKGTKERKRKDSERTGVIKEDREGGEQGESTKCLLAGNRKMTCRLGQDIKNDFHFKMFFDMWGHKVIHFLAKR